MRHCVHRPALRRYGHWRGYPCHAHAAAQAAPCRWHVQRAAAQEGCSPAPSMPASAVGCVTCSSWVCLYINKLVGVVQALRQVWGLVPSSRRPRQWRTADWQYCRSRLVWARHLPALVGCLRVALRPPDATGLVAYSVASCDRPPHLQQCSRQAGLLASLRPLRPAFALRRRAKGSHRAL